MGSMRVLWHAPPSIRGGSPSSSNRDTCNVVSQDDTRVEGMTLLCDPDTVQVTEWDMHPDAHPFIALYAVSTVRSLVRSTTPGEQLSADG